MNRDKQHVQACPWCGPMSMLHVHVQTLCINVHAACLCPCCWFKSMQHGCGHAAGTWTSSNDMSMQHGNGHAAYTVLGNTVWTWTCNMNIIIDKEHIPVHAARPCPYCMSISMLHVRVHAIVHVQVHAANPYPCWCPCLFCRDLNMQHWLEHAAWTFTHKHGHGHGDAAWTWTCCLSLLFVFVSYLLR